jgi:uncharacterized membrane protein YedE/YeeE
MQRDPGAPPGGDGGGDGGGEEDHEEGHPMTKAFREQYQTLFEHPWPVWPAAALVATLNVFLFAFDRPLTASDGVRNWGDWVLTGLGVVTRPDLIVPWLYSGSLVNLGVLVGATAAALLGREFAVRVAPVGELIKGGIGGVLMGLGAVLAFGCNIGGFFSALSALSLAGLGMMLGLGIGAWIGLRYLLWELTRRPSWSAGRTYVFAGVRPESTVQPWIGGALAALLVAVPFVYAGFGYVPQGIILLFGVVFGVVFQRSRFCLVRAFREPFMTGDGEHTRAAALALVISALGFAILKFTDLKDRGDWVFPAFWLGAVLGGVIFGLGMTLAGGCGAGSIWRAGEGQVKLWVAVLGFSLSASLTRLLLTPDALRSLGRAVFMPSVFGWAITIVLVIGVMAAWWAFATWNEESRRFAALG